ncbi:YqaJ viral recombinase family protein [Falsiroseomonas tokyonensis]|uniref:YqaJ viral recombinase family protein n=1 Tax=Falsiroseomonas tokyonensis TaxID=430521 RepID=A0ABV7BZ77_9PROT|nr:YqaJ viral recombinase family protein [Falsiroseomonas tokyonensis]MBU8540850.1 YqaJ viral recombinase family protein [Falsiroseomonas tokyonensis]
MPLLPIPPRGDDWHALRARHVGASEISILFGCAPDYLPGVYALWHVKAGLIPREEVANQRAAWGLLLEEAIAAGAAEREGWQVLPGRYASRDGLGATLDRIIAEPGPNDEGCTGPGVLELKNVDWMVHRRGWDGEPPLHILLQLQAQLAATAFTWGAVAALVGGNDLKVWRYSARPKLHAEIMARVTHFWRSIREGKPPQPDGSDATYRALMVLEPEVVDEPADLSADNEAPDLAARYLAAAAAEKAAKAEKEEARNRLLEKLGSCRWGDTTGYRISQAVTPAKDQRPARPGEIISGRAEARRIIVKELT